MHIRIHRLFKLYYLRYLTWRLGTNSVHLEPVIRLLKSRQLDSETETERRAVLIPLWVHVTIISTFPFAIALLLMSTPAIISMMIWAALLSNTLGAISVFFARRRGIRLEEKFLLLMLTSLGISTVFIAPVLVAGVVSHSFPPLVAASFLYGISLVIYLMLCFGLYGLVVNLQKPQYHLVGG